MYGMMILLFINKKIEKIIKYIIIYLIICTYIIVPIKKYLYCNELL